MSVDVKEIQALSDWEKLERDLKLNIKRAMWQNGTFYVWYKECGAADTRVTQGSTEAECFENVKYAVLLRHSHKA